MLLSARDTLVACLALALAVEAGGEFRLRRVHRDHRIIQRSPQTNTAADSFSVTSAGSDPSESPSFSLLPVPSSVLPSSSIPPASQVQTPAPAASDFALASGSTSASSTSTDGGLVSVSEFLIKFPEASMLMRNLLRTQVLNGILGDTSSSFSSSPSSSSAASSTSSSSSTSSTSSPSSSLSSSPTTVPETPTVHATDNAPLASSTHKPIVTVVATGNPEEATSVPKPTGAAQVKSTTLMILIIIASSLGGIAILWTIFRKWKLGRSSKFDERLQPIDWQPTEADRDAAPISTPRRALSNASSFHSSSAHANGGVQGRTSPLQPIPDHDFTAGAVPVGGYADLARGPSPPMGEVNRGHLPMTGGYEYDSAAPLHYQAGPGAYGAYDHNQGARY